MVDFREQLRPVQDQGPRGTCLAFAITAAHEHARFLGASLEDLSEEVLYWVCKRLDGDHIPGTRFTSAAVALESKGQPFESAWPYDPLRDDTGDCYDPPPDATHPSICHRVRLEQLFGGLVAVKQALDDRCLVALAVPISYDFHVAERGVIPMPTGGGGFVAHHAILAVGYDDDKKQLLFRNSWGRDWGDGGYGYLHYEYVDRYLRESWVVGEVLSSPVGNMSGI